MAPPRFNRALALVACTVVAAAMSCAADPAGRFKAQRDLGFRSLDDGRLEIRLDPGIRPAVDGPYRIRLQAAAPTPRLTIDYTGLESQTLSVVIANIFDDAVFSPTRSTLSDGDCAGGDSSNAVVLAPIPSELTAPTTHALSIDLVPCTRLSIQVLAGDGRGMPGGRPLELAVVGEVQGNLAMLERILARISELSDEQAWTADALVALGNLAGSPNLVDLIAWREVATSTGLPLVTALGREELQNTTLLPFHDVFGPSDFSFVIGDVELLVIDSASSFLADEQLDFWASVMSQAEVPILVSFMQTMPFDPSGARDGGFTNRAQAAHLISIMGTYGVDAVFTGGLGTYDQARIGGIPFYYTGGGGRPIEVLSDVEHHFLRVTIDVDAGSVGVEVEAVD